MAKCVFEFLSWAERVVCVFDGERPEGKENRQSVARPVVALLAPIIASFLNSLSSGVGSIDVVRAPCEADIVCTSIARTKGGFVLTGDADLVVGGVPLIFALSGASGPGGHRATWRIGRAEVFYPPWVGSDLGGVAKDDVGAGVNDGSDGDVSGEEGAADGGSGAVDVAGAAGAAGAAVFGHCR